MRTAWQSLAWKEWHEHKWQLASLVAILSSLSITAILPEVSAQEALVGLSMGLRICIMPLALFVGLGVASSENANGTLEFMQSLPVRRWQTAVGR